MCEVIATVFTALGVGAAFGAGLMVFERQGQVLHDVLDASWFFVLAGLRLWLIAEVLGLAFGHLRERFHDST